jgi:hypothetical protein
MRRYYPPECIRPISDIDIVVHPDERYRCVQIFRDVGYQLSSGTDVERMLTFHGELSWKNPQTQISVECHWDLINAASMRKVTNFDPSFIFGKLETFDVDGVTINVLPRSIELAYLMAHHVLHHKFKRLLWLADIFLIIMSEEVDWKEFEDTVKHLRMDRPVYYYLSALIRLFGREDFENILELKDKLLPQSMQYFLFSWFKRPENIFQREHCIGRLRDHIFRNAFK